MVPFKFDRTQAFTAGYRKIDGRLYVIAWDLDGKELRRVDITDEPPNPLFALLKSGQANFRKTTEITSLTLRILPFGHPANPWPTQSPRERKRRQEAHGNH